MSIVYFPGANTPQGFVSRFTSVTEDPRVRHRIYIKGGAGCGKSTLMRRLAETATAYEADCELGLCSSDPDSLDTLLIPQAQLAVCDATPPHVCEPTLCGCGSHYLDLSCYYDTAAIGAIQPELQRLQSNNRACYQRVRQILVAVQALYRLREHLPDRAQATQRLSAAAGMLLPPLQNSGTGEGTQRSLFFTGITPSGCISRYGMLQDAATIYLLQDSCHLAGYYLQTLSHLAQAAGQTVIAGYSPIDPTGAPAQLYLPQCSTAFVRQSSHFVCDLVGVTPLDLDALVQATPQICRQASYLREITARLLSEAVHELQQAKVLHDALEQRMHPYIDFSGVSQTVQRCCDALEARLTQG